MNQLIFLHTISAARHPRFPHLEKTEKQNRGKASGGGRWGKIQRKSRRKSQFSRININRKRRQTPNCTHHYDDAVRNIGTRGFRTAHTLRFMAEITVMAN